MSGTQTKSFHGPSLFVAISQDRDEDREANQAEFDIEDIQDAMAMPAITEITNKNVEYGALMWLQAYATVPYGRDRYLETFIATKRAIGFNKLGSADKRLVHEGMCRARQAINDAIRQNTSTIGEFICA